MTLETKVDLKLAIPARIENLTLALFERAYGVNDAYATITIPGQTIKGNHSMGVTDQYTPLQNMTAWEDFVHQVVFDEKASLAIAGQTNAYLGVLKSHVNLNKNIVTPSKSIIGFCFFLFPLPYYSSYTLHLVLFRSVSQEWLSDEYQ